MDATAQSQTPSTSGRWTRIHARLASALVGAVWIGATAAAVLFVRDHTRNMPFGEDFEIVGVMTGHESMTWSWAWKQSNEHRPFLPRLILGGLARAFHDFRAAMYLNVGLLSVASLSMVLLARRLRGRSSICDAALPVAILNLGQWETLLIGFALNLVLTTAITIHLISVVGRAPTMPCWRPALLVGGFALVLSLSGGSGLVLLPPLMLWLICYAASGCWSGRDASTTARIIAHGSLIATTAAVTYYISGYVKPGNVPPPGPFQAIWYTILDFLSMSITPPAWGWSHVAGMAVLALSTLTFARLLQITFRTPAERARTLGLMAILVAMLGVTASVAFSRSGISDTMGQTSRYATLSVPLLAILYISWLLYGPTPARQLIHLGILGVVLASIPANYRVADIQGDARRDAYVRIEHQLRIRTPASKLADYITPALYPGRDYALQAFRKLHSAEIGRFKYFTEDQMATTPADAVVR